MFHKAASDTKNPALLRGRLKPLPAPANSPGTNFTKSRLGFRGSSRVRHRSRHPVHRELKLNARDLGGTAPLGKSLCPNREEHTMPRSDGQIGNSRRTPVAG
jgi:hypothetical protein